MALGDDVSTSDDYNPLAVVLGSGNARIHPPSPPRWFTHPLRRRRRPRPATYRVRLDLLDAKPPIWRRLDLASDLHLDDLHVVIQTAMGWSDSHLHAFAAGARPFYPEAFRFLTPFDVHEGELGTPEGSVRLDEILSDPGDRLWYEYDFGDGWTHVVKLEKVLPRRSGDHPFRCVTGRRACPPENCGGVPGYHDLLAYLADPAGVPEWVAEHARDHLGGEFDPAELDVGEVNDELDAIRA